MTVRHGSFIHHSPKQCATHVLLMIVLVGMTFIIALSLGMKDVLGKIFTDQASVVKGVVWLGL